MDRPAEMLNSILTPEEVKRWHFSELMDYSGQKRRGQIPQSAAEVIAAYEPVVADAQRLADEHKAEHSKWPTSWTSYSEEESRAKTKQFHELEARAHRHMHYAAKLRETYSHHLAQSIWWSKVEAAEAKSKARLDAYQAACDAHRAEQCTFAEAQANAAIAALPPLSEATQKRLRTLIVIAINKASTYKEKGDYFVRERGAAPRRVKRGIPLVQVGRLPFPILPPAEYTFHWHAF